LFIHEDPTVCDRAELILKNILQELELNYRVEKAKDQYWTGSGRACLQTKWIGTSSIEFLGVSHHFLGQVGLRKKRLEKLRENLEVRAKNAVAFHQGSTDERIRAVCDALSWGLEDEVSLFPVAQASLLENFVTDRGQLKELDDWIYRLVLRTAVGSDRVFVVRKYPPRILRKHGLPSLVFNRNQKKKAAAR
jgi:hypothetical protein